MKRTAVIMAGGSGERFWPLSRRSQPKQLLRLTSDEQTMIEETIARISPLVAPQDIFIITGEALLEPMRTTLSGIPPQNIVAEPLKRNTAPCIALAAAFIAERYAEEGIAPSELSMAVLAADHYIPSPEKFRETVETAFASAEETARLVTLGITPTRPETGYGYIETAATGNNAGAETVLSFREKPSQDRAEEFIRAGNFLWNSGMFFWRVDTVIEGLQKHLPAVGNRIADLRSALAGATHQVPAGPPSGTKEAFEPMPDISIDHGLMEHAENVAVVRAGFQWDDVGSWDALPRVFSTDDRGNVQVGNTVVIDSSNCVVVNRCPEQSVTVAVVGMDNVVVVSTPDGILVCPADRAQDVKKVVQTLQQKGGEKFL
jgi:mannose-1-phosphate guanylyltransferase